jgi:hypothetical protein
METRKGKVKRAVILTASGLAVLFGSAACTITPQPDEIKLRRRKRARPAPTAR